MAFWLLSIFAACHNGETEADANGSFEADEVIVSAESPGQLVSFHVNEGDLLPADSVVGKIDPGNIQLQKEQVEASIDALSQKTSSVQPQVKLLKDQAAVQQSQLDNLLYEQQRISRLLKADAATQKQYDDISAQIEVQKRQLQVTQQQIAVAESNTNTQNRSILSEKQPLTKRVAQLQDQLDKTTIVNPVSGTVLTTYAEEGEFANIGKPLYRIADLSVLNLRAYMTGDQLSQVKLGDSVTVRIDDGKDGYLNYRGKVTWIAAEAEFTPKTIQTKEERAHLVYAMKIKVKNDGRLKIGMYGEALWTKNDEN